MRLNLKVLNLVQKRNFQASKACQILKQEHLTGQLAKSNHLLSQKINYTVFLEGEIRRLKISNEKTMGKQLACGKNNSQTKIALTIGYSILSIIRYA